jgi:uncharacterized protein
MLLEQDEETGIDRTCVATRVARPVAELIRFVADPEGRIVPDIKGKLPGRGVWVTLDRQLVAEAQKKQAFARSLKQQVTAEPDLPELTDSLLAADARQAFAFANKAGLVTTGFAKVESLIDARRASAVISAADAADDGCRKLQQAITRTHGATNGLPYLRALTGHEMDLALGRENAIHAALLPGSAGSALLKKIRRLENYRNGLPQTQDHQGGQDATRQAPPSTPQAG